MTPKQAAVLKAIRDLTINGVAPTYRQIASRIGGGSTGNICTMVDKLVEQGVLTKTYAGARSLRIVEGPSLDEMNRWSDEELRRVSSETTALLAARRLGKPRAAA